MATSTFRRSQVVSIFGCSFAIHLNSHHHLQRLPIAVISTGFFLRLSRITEIPVPPPITVTLGFLMSDSPFLSVCPCPYDCN